MSAPLRILPPLLSGDGLSRRLVAGRRSSRPASPPVNAPSVSFPCKCLDSRAAAACALTGSRSYGLRLRFLCSDLPGDQRRVSGGGGYPPRGGGMRVSLSLVLPLSSHIREAPNLRLPSAFSRYRGTSAAATRHEGPSGATRMRAQETRRGTTTPVQSGWTSLSGAARTVAWRAGMINRRRNHHLGLDRPRERCSSGLVRSSITSLMRRTAADGGDRG
jgi:hypothetical protein